MIDDGPNDHVSNAASNADPAPPAARSARRNSGSGAKTRFAHPALLLYIDGNGMPALLTSSVEVDGPKVLSQMVVHTAANP